MTSLISNTVSTKPKPRLKMEEVMDELQIRFLMNLPESELSSNERLFFQIEQCYWFYEDFYADQHSHLQHMKLNEFARRMFHHCPLLHPLKDQCEKLFQEFKTYQVQIPVNGCILLNEARDQLILVRNWKGTSWTFPRGKVNQGESNVDCAVRESLEECGYDCQKKIRPNDFLEYQKDGQAVRMYIVPDTPEDHPFAPQTRKEISLIQWFPIDNLPKRTYCVAPFLARLKRWISRGGKGTRSKKSAEKQLPPKSATSAKTTQSNSNSKAKNNRSSSAPKNRQVNSNKGRNDPNLSIKILKRNSKAILNQQNCSSRSISTPNARPNRGHFGTESETATALDECNSETFGQHTAGFSVDEMFRINENLTGRNFSYNGNPQEFGNVKKPNKRSSDSGLAPSVAALFQSAQAASFKHGPTPSNYSPLSVPVSLQLPIPFTPALSSSSVPSNSSQLRSKDESSAKSSITAFEFDKVDIMACVT